MPRSFRICIACFLLGQQWHAFSFLLIKPAMLPSIHSAVVSFNRGNRAERTKLNMAWNGEKGAKAFLKELEEMETKAKQQLEQFTEEMSKEYAQMREKFTNKQLDDILEGNWASKVDERKRKLALNTWLKSWAKNKDFNEETFSQILKKIQVGSSLLKPPMTEEDMQIIPETDLSQKDRKIWVVTTACLPWMTGTSINPLLRAAILAEQRGPGKITLMVPFLRSADQKKLFPPGVIFVTEEEQSVYVKEWLKKNTKFSKGADNLSLQFYPSRYHEVFGSIFAMGDITYLIPDDESDICILEEPEHLNWYRSEGSSWYQKFNHVIGICHTNYRTYMGEGSNNKVLEAMMHYINIWMVRAYCHRVIKLSGVLQKYAPEKEVVCNVHGVRDTFLEIGAEKAKTKEFTKGAYFIGKKLWGKGYDLMCSLLDYCESGGPNREPVSVAMDLYGSGPDEKEIEETFEQRNLPVSFHPATDHAQLSEYKVFINPSISEVLCTTTAEALAMGKFTIIPDHPSNVFFKQFPNCLMYRDKVEFRKQLIFAQNEAPVPMTVELLHPFTWEAATERLIESSAITYGERRRFNEELDRFCEWSHITAGHGYKGDLVRWIAGGQNVAEQTAYTNRIEKGYQDANSFEDKRAYIRRVEEAYQDQVSVVDLLKNFQKAQEESLSSVIKKEELSRLFKPKMLSEKRSSK
mmetsp:Transcript_6153/g.8011  ORF Transcript_6153/g.8011 Transcript_6153/m.8011 type:complete len:691 (+) Transcript_6153:209-2281(+)